MTVANVPNTRTRWLLTCGHEVTFPHPAPAVGDHVTCLRCWRGAQIAEKTEGGA